MEWGPANFGAVQLAADLGTCAGLNSTTLCESGGQSYVLHANRCGLIHVSLHYLKLALGSLGQRLCPSGLPLRPRDAAGNQRPDPGLPDPLPPLPEGGG